MCRRWCCVVGCVEQVEVTTTKKSAERRKDVGLITIKTVTESRPFVIQTVIDARTEKRLSVADAATAGILDQQRGFYRNSITDEQLSLADALDSGLLEVEFEQDLANGNGSATRHNQLDLLANDNLGWRRGAVVSGVRHMNEVNARRARLLPGWVTRLWGGYTISVCNKPTRSTQPCIPPGLLNRVPASAGVRAECHLCRVAGNTV